jgi:hypothetical protein
MENVVLKLHFKATNNYQAWTGYILMKDNFWFEGIARVDSLNYADKEDNELVIGMLINYNRIILMKYSLKLFSEYKICGISDGEKIIGSVELHTPFDDIYGRECCEIYVDYVNMSKEDINTLENDISIFKQMADNCKKLMENFKVDKNDFILKFLSNFKDAPVIPIKSLVKNKTV